MYRFNQEADGRLLAGPHYNPLVDGCVVRVSRTGEVLGGVRYCDHQPPASVAAHVRTFHPSWLSRDFLWLGMSIPFEMLKVERVFGYLPDDNNRILNLAKRVGFKELCRVPNGKDKVVIICSLEKSDAARWLEWKPKTIRPLYPTISESFRINKHDHE
jgi:hypothetical protein